MESFRIFNRMTIDGSASNLEKEILEHGQAQAQIGAGKGVVNVLFYRGEDGLYYYRPTSSPEGTDWSDGHAAVGDAVKECFQGIYDMVFRAEQPDPHFQSGVDEYNRLRNRIRQVVELEIERIAGELKIPSQGLCERFEHGIAKQVSDMMLRAHRRPGVGAYEGYEISNIMG